MTYAEFKDRVLRRLTARYLIRLLKYCQFNMSEAARIAGLERSNFYHLLKRYDVYDSHIAKQRKS